MGRLLVILLVMLIPLRGLSAERMAVQMAQSQAMVEIAGMQTSQAPMPADCPMMFNAGKEAGESSTSATSKPVCQTCQLCMSLANQSHLTFKVTAPQPQAPIASAAASFISVDLAPQVKPPIL